ncbi:hypothetical protein A9Q96_05920 [Rhodobacterales bacterium 52_120_T64]|nr:hypothetical protein A9Q96_05920 [Rhodobacterales bacterium 52_120_T64]
MPDSFNRKPANNTLLTLLSALDVIVIMGGVAALPISRFVHGTFALNPLHSYGITNAQLIGSVPFFAVVMVILAWMAHSTGKVTAARMIAATPLFWGMAVFLMLLPSLV